MVLSDDEKLFIISQQIYDKEVELYRTELELEMITNQQLRNRLHEKLGALRYQIDRLNRVKPQTDAPGQPAIKRLTE